MNGWNLDHDAFLILQIYHTNKIDIECEVSYVSTNCKFERLHISYDLRFNGSKWMSIQIMLFNINDKEHYSINNDDIELLNILMNISNTN